MAELTGTATEFPKYNMRQLMGSSTRSRTLSQQHRQRPDVPEIEDEQDEAIRAMAELELADLEAHQDDVVEEDSSDSSDKDYQPIPRMLPRAHDKEVGGSISAPPPPPRTNPALLVILERMW
jgi:hypothetical protein